MSHLNLVLCNLLHAHFQLPGIWVRYHSMSNRYRKVPRYHPYGCSYTHMMAVTRGLRAKGLVDYKRGFYYREDQQGKLSRIRAKPSLIAMAVGEVGVRPDDVSSRFKPELITLRDWKKLAIPYRDNAHTSHMRDRLVRYNACLKAHEIVLRGLGRGERSLLGDYPVDFTRTEYHQVFSNSSFDLGGRFYGPWWQNLKSDLRRFIQIDGAAATGLDYSAIHIHLLYGLNGLNYADLYGDADPYSLENENTFERTVLKLALLVALNAKDENKAIWATIRKLRKIGEYVTYTSLKKLLGRFADKHSRIRDQFFSGVGLSLQRTEAIVSERVIDYFTERDIPILNVHDCFVCGIEHDATLHQRMVEAFRELDLPSIPTIKKEF